MSGTLYIVSTPIGNLEDITLRALRVLKEVDLIAAEDTRHSLKLLHRYGVAKPIISYWSEKEKIRADEILRRLLSGQSVALVSDAGTPGISDPGAVLIRRAIEEGIVVVPIPGPSAFVAALSVSGLSTEEFTFFGFLPPKTVQRQKKLRDIMLEPRTLVFYEAPHRLLATLEDMRAVLGERPAVVAKEITKMHETVVRGALTGIIASLEAGVLAGEYVIVVEGRKKESAGMEEALGEIRALMRRGKGRKEAVKQIAEEYGLSRKELYDRSLHEKGGDEGE